MIYLDEQFSKESIDSRRKEVIDIIESYCKKHGYTLNQLDNYISIPKSIINDFYRLYFQIDDFSDKTIKWGKFEICYVCDSDTLRNIKIDKVCNFMKQIESTLTVI